MSANIRSIEKRTKNAPINIASTESDDGMVSVKKVTT